MVMVVLRGCTMVYGDGDSTQHTYTRKVTTTTPKKGGPVNAEARRGERRMGAGPKPGHTGTGMQIFRLTSRQ